MYDAFGAVKYESNLQVSSRLQSPNCLLRNFARIVQGVQMSALDPDPPYHEEAT